MAFVLMWVIIANHLVISFLHSIHARECTCIWAACCPAACKRKDEDCTALYGKEITKRLKTNHNAPIKDGTYSLCLLGLGLLCSNIVHSRTLPFYSYKSCYIFSSYAIS